jgi:hypothetical protein
MEFGLKYIANTIANSALRLPQAVGPEPPLSQPCC